MKKIKTLILGVVMVMGLSTLSLAFSQGDEVRVRVTGYVGGPNGTLSAAGINCIAGKTAAVSYTGGIGNPDLKYGTIVYLESQNKCYVICDVGSSKAGASLGIEPFCSTVAECYSITGYSTAKILYVPTGGNAYNNVINSLNNLHKYTGNEEVESGATQTKTCQTCGDVIGTAYYPLGNKHYRACANGHHSYIEDHNYVNGECKTCGAVKSNKTESGVAQTSACPNCGEVIKDKWLDRNGINHYRACANGHEWYVEAHKWNAENKCDICKLTKVLNQKVDSITGIKKVLFSDLPVDHWAYNDVKAMVEAGIINGRGDGTFGTNDPITVEEFLALLSRIAVAKKGDIAYSNNGYLVDRIEGWSNRDYRKLIPHIENPILDKQVGESEIKLILGNNDEEVLTNYKKPITREKAANITSALLNTTNTSSVNILNANDWNNVNSIYRKGINSLAEINIFRGVDNGDGTVSVNPQNTITRVEAIALLNRLYNVL